MITSTSQLLRNSHWSFEIFTRASDFEKKVIWWQFLQNMLNLLEFSITSHPMLSYYKDKPIHIHRKYFCVFFYRSMSSKRKNTPTKLPKDSTSEVDSDSDTETSLHIVTKSDSENQDSDSSSSRPASKKQRILQSVRRDSDSDTELDLLSPHQLHHHLSTKSSLGLQRKSMESVLRRLSSKTDIGELENNNMNEDSKVKESIQVLLSDGSLTEKEQRLSEMIAQLQNLKENLSTQKQVQLSSQYFCYMCICSWLHEGMII